MADRDPQIRTWKLEDAKARFSEVVRRARTDGPQLVTVHGKPAVTVTSVATGSVPPIEQMSLVELFANSPFADLREDIEFDNPTYSPTRKPFEF